MIFYWLHSLTCWGTPIADVDADGEDEHDDDILLDVDDDVDVDENIHNEEIDVIAPNMVSDEDDECSSSTGSYSYRMRSLDLSIYPLTILFGSETGRSEVYARELAQEAKEHGFLPTVMDLDEAVHQGFHSVVSHGMFRLQEMKYSDHSFPVIIVVSTQSEGTHPENANAFVKMLYEKSTDSASFLNSIDYCIFGLGDSMYGHEHFNATAKKFDNYFHKLGADRLLDLYCGDDNQDLDGDFINWKLGQVWPALRAKYFTNSIRSVSCLNTSQTSLSSNFSIGCNITSSLSSECPFVIDYLPESEVLLENSIRGDQFLSDNIAASSLQYFTAHDCHITCKRELRSVEDNTGSTLHLEVDVGDSFEYHTGDLLGVLPKNIISDVERLSHSLGLNLDDNFILLPSSSQHDDEFTHIFPTPCSIRECLTRYCDLTSPLSRRCLKSLIPFATSPRDFMRLKLLFASKDEYQRIIVDGHIGLVDMICTVCPSIKLSLQNFIFLSRRLQPRYFAIASSSLVHPKSVHLAVSLAHGVSNNGIRYMGICSAHMQQLEVGETIRVFPQEATSMRPPQNPSDPMMMVGPGVGVGALRAILQERSYQRKHLGMKVGKTTLYFGCKNHWLDDIYSSELEEFRKDGTLDYLHVAYSREHQDKVYVQYLLARNAEETFSLFHDQNAIFYLTGGEKMGNDVFQALIAIFAVYGNLGPHGALLFAEQLRKEQRWNRQTWV